MKKTIKYLAATTGATYGFFSGVKYYRKNHMYNTEPNKVDKLDFITVNIWDRSEKSEVGHASIKLGEDESEYLSFWPEDGVLPYEKEGMVKSVTARLNKFREDIAIEERVPDHVIMLFLNKEKMFKEHSKIKKEVEESKTGYCLSGRNLNIKGGKCMNCTTACFRLLVAGGFDKVPILDDTLTSPSSLLDMIKQAEINQFKANK